MQQSRFEEYLARFNAEDVTVFDDFLHHDVKVLNGNLELHGVEAMKAHYAGHIWPDFDERLDLLRFVGNEETAAVQLWTRFEARHDSPHSLFGAVVKGDRFDYRGIIMYELRDEKFTSITVAYNAFSKMAVSGAITQLGIVH
jgi:SnoaL-like polyketide cyclase.